MILLKVLFRICCMVFIPLVLHGETTHVSIEQDNSRPKIEVLKEWEENATHYFQYLSSEKHSRPIGSWEKGEMEMIGDKEGFLQAQNLYYEELCKQMKDEKKALRYSKIGIVTEDAYWLWLRDPVLLPSKKMTGYNRLVPRVKSKEGVTCASVMALSADKDILVNVAFRHATGSWEVELPRGGVGRGENPVDTARRELKEEAGYSAENLVKLISINPENGVIGWLTNIYLASGLSPVSLQRGEEELIAKSVFLSKSVLKQGLIDGFIELDIGERHVKAHCREGYLAIALFIAEAKSLL